MYTVIHRIKWLIKHLFIVRDLKRQLKENTSGVKRDLGGGDNAHMTGLYGRIICKCEPCTICIIYVLHTISCSGWNSTKCSYTTTRQSQGCIVILQGKKSYPEIMNKTDSSGHRTGVSIYPSLGSRVKYF